jgi:hypothetical protein
VLSIGFYINSLLVETRDKSTLYALILYWSRARRANALRSLPGSSHCWGWLVSMDGLLYWGICGKKMDGLYEAWLLPQKIPSAGLELDFVRPVGPRYSKYCQRVLITS